MIAGNYLGNGNTGDLDFLSSLSNCSLLQILDLEANRLGGPLPESIGNLSIQLNMLFMGWNQISGNIPEGIGNLVSLTLLHLPRNALAGTLPTSLGKLRNLERLFLGLNNFSGEIPSFIGNLSHSFELQLHNNSFEKKIPLVLRNCKSMQILFLSGNTLGGSIPDQLFGAFTSLTQVDMSSSSLTGPLPSDFDNLKNLEELFIYGNKLSDEIPEILGQCFGLRSLDMVGNFFKEAKEKLVAVKVLNLQNRGAAKSFMAECKALGKVRHRNVLKIITSCSSIDYQGKDFKALVFEFIPNWSLDSWLHEQHESRYLNFVQSDFGLAKLLSSDTNNMGNDQTVSPEGDIYGYGTLLLEMITGRRPTDGMFHGGLSLHNFCKMALPERLKEILDFRLLEQISENNERLTS
ncbi:Serine-threonine/tyrosine-protein kinase [Theobroma cacao]|nr:Serine-threonine/tyrosine-protein kinase [Theobroma cacao]